MSVVAIGSTSFMAGAVQRCPAASGWRFLRHAEALADLDWIDGASCVVNFALDPQVRAGVVTDATNIDARIAREIFARRSDLSYVMLSSRMVYGRPGLLREDDPCSPVNPYGKGKLSVEESLRAALPPENLTILRIANVFGFEPGRKSFFGMALTRLRDEGKIVYDMSPLVRRDFLFVDRFATILSAICAAPRPGVFNLGSGVGLETGLIAQDLIAGYGRGILEVTAFGQGDDFTLDMTKTNATWGLTPMDRDAVRADILACGRRLRAEESGAAL
ncbi:MAG: NAD-dependent epimerase/dehydratase family protein [Rhodospirillales bacterium]|nr:NAD-dependent epimerase/dehydratase family protein [Rhodospirillales bacterium]